MRRSLFRGVLVAIYLLAFGTMTGSQTRLAVPVPSLAPDLSHVTRTAGIIFAGRVLSIQPLRLSSSDQVASVEITFQVEQAVRGARAGEKLSVREWAGLWTSGERYRIGERLLLFLYAPSALGLTSPVGGSAGRFAVDRNNRIVLSEAQRQSIRRSPTPVRIDEKHPVPLRDFTRAIRRMSEE
jgi:hypothetical protein